MKDPILLIILMVMCKLISGHSDGCELNDGHAMCLCSHTKSIFCTGIRKFPMFKDAKFVQDIIIADSPLLLSLEIDRKRFENLEDIFVLNCPSIHRREFEHLMIKGIRVRVKNATTHLNLVRFPFHF